MKKIVIIKVILFLLVIISCKQEIEEMSNNLNVPNLEKKAIYVNEKFEYDKNIRKFAKILAKSLKHPELRVLIKEEAIIKIDGDYTIFWKNFKGERIKNNSGDLEVLDLLVRETDEFTDRKKNILSKEIEEFTNKYPKLQISVPVNCEKWDVKNYIPLVAFLTSDYSINDEYIEAFDCNGNVQKISNKQVPQFPVIAVSLNERSDENGEILESYIKSASFIENINNITVPYNLTGSNSTNGNHLNWNYPSTPGVEIEIHRDNGIGYQIIEILPSFITDYLDVNVVPEMDYFYKLRAYDLYNNTYSEFSNTIRISTSLTPNAPTSFTVENYAPNQFRLLWVNPTGFTTGTIIRGRVYNESTAIWGNWEDIVTVSNSVNEYIDNLNFAIGRNQIPVYGQKMHYQIRSVNNYGESKNGAFDVAYNAERQNNQPLYLRSIEVPNVSDIEPWIKGNPEFRITVATMDDISNPYKILENRQIHTGDRDGYYFFAEQMVSEWNNSFLKSVMSINIYEFDDDFWVGSKNVKFPALKEVKTPVDKLYGLISQVLGGEITIRVKNNDYEIGTAYIKYYDNPQKKVILNKGIKVGFDNRYPSSSPRP